MSNVVDIKDVKFAKTLPVVKSAPKAEAKAKALPEKKVSPKTESKAKTLPVKVAPKTDKPKAKLPNKIAKKLGLTDEIKVEVAASEVIDMKPEPEKVADHVEAKPEAKQPEKKKIVPKAKPIATLVFADKLALLDTLKVAMNCIGKKSTLPILNCVNLNAADKAADIAASDLECSFVKAVPCTADQPINVCIPGKTFLEEISALPDGTEKADLQFYIKDNEYPSNYVVINNRAVIYTMLGEEFPEIPVKLMKGKKSVEIKGLVDNIKSVLAAAGQDDNRYTLNGVYFDLAEGKMVGTDGHRLHFCGIEKNAEVKPFVCPSKAMAIVVKMKSSDKFLVSDEMSLFSVSGGSLYVRHIEGTYPSYQKIIPKANEIKVEFETKEFLELLEGAMPLSNANKSVKFNYKTTSMEVVAANVELGSYKWVFPIKMSGISEISLAFNAGYILDALRSFPSEQTSVTIGDNLGPILINGKAVVMPMRA